ncbi:splicing factor sf1 [Moniliophthora roreri MCA 2997]|uniref:Branchpoint-bridging protein n=2 Tax=Moniliophthora roreri TaxID=221103 RepID=V2XF32_MONRO|nr:splicing factor sf1 [Moniliophthora roreri MCA 2997]KAI3613718.1 splicing factor sf1 [Moniliophthora roreri]
MWRPATRQITGTNDVPLGQRRRFGPAPTEDSAPPQLAQPSPSAYPRQHDNESPGKRGREESPASGDPKIDPNAPRKRRSRWGDVKTEIPGLPTAISAAGVSQAQLDNYAIHLRLEEINRKLRLNDYVPPERERSPSPPPTYDSHGRRTNTREVRYKKKLEDERIRLVDRAMKNDPNFRPPVEYHQQKRSQRPSEKVYIPVKEFPEINFFGLLVGPRGNSLKKMERESGAKISIRGKGSVKEGKARPDQYAEDAEEDLHCLVLADSQEKVAACVKMINKVIETAASTPEGQNDHKRNQLRELAALNGTLRDDENQICQNCGGVGHRKYDCPEQRNFTANIICRVCGSAGHMARDCTVNKDPNAPTPPPPPPMSAGARTFDSDYASLMAELGESTGGASGDLSKSSWPAAGHDITGGGLNVPPWRRPENWVQANIQQPQGGYRPPMSGQSGYNPGGYAGGQGWAGYPGYSQGQNYSSGNYAAYYNGQYAQQPAAA